MSEPAATAYLLGMLAGLIGCALWAIYELLLFIQAPSRP